MSRSYAFKPDIKKRPAKERTERRVVLDDFEIEYLELSLGPDIRLSL